MRIFRRGQDLIAQRCTHVVSRHLQGEALATAATNRKVDIMEALLESNSVFDLAELTKTLNSVCAWGSKEALQLVLKHDATKVLGIQHYSSGLNQSLQVASRNGHKEVVEYLIGEGADVNSVVEEVRYSSGGDQLLYGSTRKLSVLQAALVGFERFGPTTNYEHLLNRHLRNRHLWNRHLWNRHLRNLHPSWTEADVSSQQQVFEMLLAKGANPNGADEYERSPLNIAAAYCTVQIVQELISLGALIEPATKEHGTALQAAASREIGGLPIIKALLEANTPVPSIHPGKAAALNEALSFFKDSGRFEVSASITDVLSTGPGAVVKILLANLPEEKADDSRYDLLAQMACMAGHQEWVELLLQRGLDVNGVGNYYGTALQAASRVGNIDIVERLLSSGADVNIPKGVHGTAVRAAALGGHEDVVRNLVAHGADVNLRYKNRGVSILHLALESRKPEIFKTLLVAGAALNTIIANPQHILIAACKHGDTTLVELLIANSVDVNVLGTKPNHYHSIPDKEATPMNAACAEGHLSVVRLLLDHGADIEKTNESSATPLMTAIHGENLSTVRLLLDAGANVNHAVNNTSVTVNHANYVTPLSIAAEDSKLEIVEILLSAGAIIGGPSTKRNALAEACNSRQYRVVELLLGALSGTEHETDVCGEALHAAIKSGDGELVRLLLEYGTSPSFDMLRQACAAGTLEAVKMLVDLGIDINEEDGDDAPLLHVAASHSRPSIVQFLIDSGANVMLRSTKYGSPLIAALEGSIAPLLGSYSQPESCQSLAKQLPHSGPVDPIDQWNSGIQSELGCKDISNCEHVVRSLFNADAEIDTTIRSFGNALHLASYMGSEVIVRQLLEKMEDVNIFGGYFGSPLIAGLKGHHPIIVELLLDRGIEVNHCSPEHGSALHCACAHGSKKLIQSLLDHGADINAYNDKHGSTLATATSRGVNQFVRCRGTPSRQQRAIVELLLRHEPKLQIRECDLLAAASWEHLSDGQNFMSLFLRHDQSAVPTEVVFVEAIQNYTRISTASGENLQLLLKHDRGLGTTPAMLKAAKDVDVMEMLLKHEPVCQVTADVLDSTANQGIRHLEMLLRHDPKAPVTETTMELYREFEKKWSKNLASGSVSNK